MSVTGSASEAARKDRQGRVALGCFFFVFLAVGVISTVAGLWPIVHILRARDWRQVPCTVIKSEVAVHRGTKGGPTYSIEIQYEYLVDDERHVGTRYHFVTGSSSGYKSKKAVVDLLPPGTASFCFVNRRDPGESVMDRGFTPDILYGLIPMIFALVGAGGLYGIFFWKRAARRGRPGVAGAPAPAQSAAASLPATLKPTTSPGCRLGCAFGFALFWNVMVGFLLASVIDAWSRGRGQGCITVVCIPLSLVGLGLIVLTVYTFLGLFNPRPSLRVIPGSAALGDLVEVEWATPGNVDRIRSFTITLEGREEATYRRGKSTSSKKSVFKVIEIFTATRGRELRRGKAAVTIPADTMHSFKSSNNQILWSFHVKGVIPWWPDVGEEFPFEILPQRLPSGGKA